MCKNVASSGFDFVDWIVDWIFVKILLFLFHKLCMDKGLVHQCIVGYLVVAYIELYYCNPKLI